jgi:hypothetical protein
MVSTCTRLAALRLVKVGYGNASSESRFVDRKTVGLDVVNGRRLLVHGWCLDRLELIEDSLWAGDRRGACCADAWIESGISGGSVLSCDLVKCLWLKSESNCFGIIG